MSFLVTVLSKVGGSEMRLISHATFIVKTSTFVDVKNDNHDHFRIFERIV